MTSDQVARCIMDNTDTISSMLRQEEQWYMTRDYLVDDNELNDHGLSSSTPASSSTYLDVVTSDCRTKMVDWSYKIVDFCHLNPDTVAIAMNYLDRYMMITSTNTNTKSTDQHDDFVICHADRNDVDASSRMDRCTFQLASMACLYTAVKIHEPAALDPETMAKMSRGIYQAHDLEQMEFKILTALNWRVNPPIAVAFGLGCLDLICSNDDINDDKQAIYELVRQQTQLAVYEDGLLSVKPSIIAYCAILNAFSIHYDDENSTTTTRRLQQEIWTTLLLLGENHHDQQEEEQQQALISQVQSWLYDAVIMSRIQQHSQQQKSLLQHCTAIIISTPPKHFKMEKQVTSSLSSLEDQDHSSSPTLTTPPSSALRKVSNDFSPRCVADAVASS